MRDPLSRLKLLPWRSLALAASLSLLLCLVVEFLLVLGAMKLAIVAKLLTLLFASAFAVLASFAVGVGFGALAVYILEQLDCPALNTATLWALVPCLIVAALVRNLLPFPPVLLQSDYTQCIGMLVGVFWKGRPYWQSYRRW